MDEKEIIIFKKPSKWTAWRLQRRILKKHAYIFGVKPRLFESNESLRQRILEKTMKIYRNPFVSYPCYFVKTGAGWSGRAEASKSKGYCVEQHDGKWTCRNGCYYDDTIRNELILVAENRESIHKVIEKAVIDAVLGLVREKEKQKEESGHDEQKPD